MEVLVELLTMEGCEVSMAADGEAAIRMIDEHRYDLLLTDLKLPKADGFQVLAHLQRVSPSSSAIVMTGYGSIESAVEAMRRGAFDYITKPLALEQLRLVIKRFKEQHEAERSAQVARGQIITVFGSKGGVGTTTIALNLAVSLLEANAQRSVVLVDLNPQFGDVALFLDMEPAHTLGDIAKNISRLDETFLMSILSKHASGLSLLPSPHILEEIGAVTPAGASRTLELLQPLFDYIIVDSGHLIDDIAVATMKMSSSILLVSALTLHILRSTRRVLDLFSSVGLGDDQIKIILNKYASNTEVSLKDSESILGQKIFKIIPHDYATTVSAINTGKPLSMTAPRADITKSLKQLALDIAPVASSKRNLSFIPKLFSFQL